MNSNFQLIDIISPIAGLIVRYAKGKGANDDQIKKKAAEIIDTAAIGAANMFGQGETLAKLRNIITGGSDYEEKISQLKDVLKSMKGLRADPAVTSALNQAQNALNQAISGGGRDMSTVWAANRDAGMKKQKQIKDAQAQLDKATTDYENEIAKVSDRQTQASHLVTTAMALADKDTVKSERYFDDVMTALKDYQK